MKVFEIQCAIWDRIHYFTFSEGDLVVGDYVIIKNDQNLELVKVVGKLDLKDDVIAGMDEVRSILRKATTEEIERAKYREDSKQNDIDVCEGYIKKHGLKMKIIDVYYSLDGGKVTFAFAAEGRIDFRNLVKDLTNHYHKSIRLQQLGVRDVARAWGDVGVCGRQQCCKGHLKKLVNITTDMAEVQQVSHRGSDRLSGACGRLKCCLSYELDSYKDLVKKMPPIGTHVTTMEGEKGVVSDWRILNKAVLVKVTETDRIVEAQINTIKIRKN